MNFIKENIRGNTTKGFILVEIMLVFSLIGILISMEIIVISKYMRVHRQEIEKSRESFYVNEALMLIEYHVNSAEHVEVDENKIKLKRFNGSGYDYIRKDRQSDIIISYGSAYSSTTNNILKKTKDFKVEKAGGVIYISIEMDKGRIYRRCLGLERLKVRATS